MEKRGKGFMGMNVKTYQEDSLWMLQQEVKQLEHETLDAIENLESRLHAMAEITPALQEEDWSPRLDTIEIITMEQLPPLTESIRQIR